MTGRYEVRDMAPETVQIIRRFAVVYGGTHADVLTLMAGEYAKNHEGELLAWARGETDQ